MNTTTSTKTVITIFFDDADKANKGWAYHTVVTSFDDDGFSIEQEHDTGAIDVKRSDAGITTLRRSFFRNAGEGSFFANLRAEAAQRHWSRIEGGWRVVIKHNS